MSNEASLRSRWNGLYHDSDEYQSALRSDAISRTSRAAQYRDAARRASAGGDIGRSVDLSLEAMRARRQPGERAEGLDEFQDNRVTDYIAQATKRGREAATAARSNPLSSVANGPGYYASLENPDFATHFPYAELRDRSRYGHYGLSRGAVGGNPSTPPPADPNLDPQVARMHAIDAYNNTLSTVRREQHLLSSLPKPLAEAYRQKYLSQGGATPEERQDFLSKPPEYQYGRLRSAVAASSPKAPGTGSNTFGTASFDYPGVGATKVVGSSGSIGMPTIQPLGTTRATAELNQPKDVLAGTGTQVGPFDEDQD